MKISHEKFSKIILLTITILILIIFTWSVYFIYQDVYKIIILVPTLENLKMQASFDLIRIDFFEQIKEHLGLKTASLEKINWSDTNNPF